MVDKEMLSAISDLLEEKLEQKLEEKLEEKLEKKLDEKLEEKLSTIKCKFDSMESEINTINRRLDNVEQDVRHIRVVQLENDVIPRISTIESCYLDTYKRYQKSTDKIDGIAGDVEILKLTVSEHSGRLAQLPV